MKSDQIREGYCFQIFYKNNIQIDRKTTYVFAKNFAQAEQIFAAQQIGKIQIIEQLGSAAAIKQ